MPWQLSIDKKFHATKVSIRFTFTIRVTLIGANALFNDGR